MRRPWIAFVTLIVAISGTGASAVILVPPVPEQLVEGHTVFLVIETVRAATRVEEYAAAVVVLIRERVITTTATRFPGVLWSNDQYLTDPDLSRGRNVALRHPCTGVAIAVNRGDLIVDQDLGGNWTLIDPVYVESYFITDPNDRAWIVDLWNTSYGRPAWTSAIMNDQAGGGIPDDGKCRGPVQTDSSHFCTSEPIRGQLPPDQRCPRGVGPADPQGPLNMALPDRKDPGDHGHDHPCDGCSNVQYNALLYIRLQHLDVAATPKDHTEGTGDDWQNDVAACSASSTGSWNCPGGNDDREGNSHPYNPGYVFSPYDGEDNHGGSDVCDGNATDCHATRNIDLYYGYVQPPLTRTMVVNDVVGSEAPFHCHQTFASICT